VDRSSTSCLLVKVWDHDSHRRAEGVTNLSTDINGIQRLDKELWREFGKNDYGLSQFRDVGGNHMILIKYAWLTKDDLNLNKFVDVDVEVEVMENNPQW